MRGKTIYNRPDIKDYLVSNETISAYEIRLKFGLAANTAQDIIKRLVKRNQAEMIGYFKLPTQRNKIIMYRITDREGIMKTFAELAYDEWQKMKVEKGIGITATNTNTNTNLPSVHSTKVPSTVPSILKEVLSTNNLVPSGAFVSVPTTSESLQQSSGKHLEVPESLLKGIEAAELVRKKKQLLQDASNFWRCGKAERGDAAYEEAMSISGH